MIDSKVLMKTSKMSGCMLFNKFKHHLLKSMTYQQFTYYRVVSKIFIERRLHKSTATSPGHRSKKKLNSEISSSDIVDADDVIQIPDTFETRVADFLQELKSTSNVSTYRRYKRAYVFDEKVAESLVAKILKHRNVKDAPILEVQAGAGVLSRQFLQNGVSKVISTEYLKEFAPFLQEIQQEFGEKFEHFEWAILSLWAKYSSNKKDSRVVNYKLFEEMITKSLNAATGNHDKSYSLLILGDRFKNMRLQYFLTTMVAWDDPLFSRKGVDFFFLMHPLTKWHLEILRGIAGSSRSVKNYSLWLTHLFYEVEIIQTVHVEDFWPPLNVKRYRHADTKALDKSVRYLVRMKLKENIDSILPLNQHLSFSYFVRQIYARVSSRIIPTLDKLVPGCGLRMLPLGFTMMEQINEISPERILQLYKEILNWPEYANSPLHDHIRQKGMGVLDDNVGQEEEESLEEDDDLDIHAADHVRNGNIES